MADWWREAMPTLQQKPICHIDSISPRRTAHECHFDLLYKDQTCLTKNRSNHPTFLLSILDIRVGMDTPQVETLNSLMIQYNILVSKLENGNQTFKSTS